MLCGESAADTRSRTGPIFVLAGMYDFEIAEDVQIVNRTLAGLPQRVRAWRG